MKEKEVEKEIEEKIEKKVEEKVEKAFEMTGKKVGYLATIFLSLTMIYFVNNVLDWDIKFFDFILDDFQDTLWIQNVSLVFTMVINAMLLIYDKKVFKSALQIIENVVSAVLVVTLLRVFPFDFKLLIDVSLINTLVKIFFSLGLVGLTIGTITDLVRIITSLAKCSKKE
jgi:hypothetical protein